MDLDRHDFQLDELVERIKSNDNRLVALQVPEGLKMQALEMMDKIEDDFSHYKTSSPVLDAQFIDGSWRWTGWRHDGSLTGQVMDILERDNVGVAVINGSVLTNDGSWSEWRATRQT